MYSQYQHNNAQYGASSTSGMVWNGNQWISPSSNSVAYTQQPTPLYTQQRQSYPQQSKQPQQQNLVTLYTDFYHKWKAMEEQYRSEHNKLSEAEWAKYHSDLSSRAAHYFHSNPTARTAPPEYVLPPAPPNYTPPNFIQPSASENRTIHNSQYNSQNEGRQPQTLGAETTNDGMKGYADRCLRQHGVQKDVMMRQIEAMIQQCLKDGTLHTTNWEAKPLLPANPSMVTPSSFVGVSTGRRASAKNSIHNSRSSESNYCAPRQSSGSYYGPSGGGPAPSKNVFASQGTSGKKKKRKASEKRTENANYYGPSSSDGNSSTQGNETFIAVPSHNKHNKRRKSMGFDQTHSAMASRASRFSGPGGISEAAGSATAGVGGEWDKFMGKETIGGSRKVLNESDYERMTVKGTCTVLEKDYLRLTAPPRAELVRTLPTLQQHLRNLKVERKSSNHDYLWYCSQFKALRQDLTVQRIQNSFAVEVYETHARVALEENDMNEYNQCQTQLKDLYAVISSRPDSDADKCLALKNTIEFVSYRLIYYVFLFIENQKYDPSDMFNILLTLTNDERQDPKIKHALAVREACFSDILDYSAFFCLKKTCPSEGALQLMERIAPSVRYKALQRMCRGYRPTTVAVQFVLQNLGCKTDAKGDIEIGRKWLQSCGCILSADGQFWLTKESSIHESDLEGKKTLI